MWLRRGVRSGRSVWAPRLDDRPNIIDGHTNGALEHAEMLRPAQEGATGHATPRHILGRRRSSVVPGPRGRTLGPRHAHLVPGRIRVGFAGAGRVVMLLLPRPKERRKRVAQRPAMGRPRGPALLGWCCRFRVRRAGVDLKRESIQDLEIVWSVGKPWLSRRRIYWATLLSGLLFMARHRARSRRPRRSHGRLERSPNGRDRFIGNDVRSALHGIAAASSLEFNICVAEGTTVNGRSTGEVRC